MTNKINLIISDTEIRIQEKNLEEDLESLKYSEEVYKYEETHEVFWR